MKKSQNNLSIDNCCFKNIAIIKTPGKNYKNLTYNKYKDIYCKKLWHAPSSPTGCLIVAREWHWVEWEKYVYSFTPIRVTLGVKAIPFYPAKVCGQKSNLFWGSGNPFSSWWILILCVQIMLLRPGQPTRQELLLKSTGFLMRSMLWGRQLSMSCNLILTVHKGKLMNFSAFYGKIISILPVYRKQSSVRQETWW